MSDIMVLFTIVIIIWFGIGGYVFYLHKKVGKLEKEISRMKDKEYRLKITTDYSDYLKDKRMRGSKREG